MNRDATIVQIAIFLIIVAIVGVVILKQSTGSSTQSVQQHITPIQEGIKHKGNAFSTGQVFVEKKAKETSSDALHPIEKTSSVYTKIVKQYFAAIAKKDYTMACDIMVGGKCNASRKSSVRGFSKEFRKMINGYEYVNIKDFGFISPSKKHVVCVKYNYRYKDDRSHGLVSEIMSFYIDKVGKRLKITNRVCEKKYKEGRGLRHCPIEASKNFCIGLIH